MYSWVVDSLSWLIQTTTEKPSSSAYYSQISAPLPEIPTTGGSIRPDTSPFAISTTREMLIESLKNLDNDLRAVAAEHFLNILVHNSRHLHLAHPLPLHTEQTAEMMLGVMAEHLLSQAQSVIDFLLLREVQTEVKDSPLSQATVGLGIKK